MDCDDVFEEVAYDTEVTCTATNSTVLPEPTNATTSNTKVCQRLRPRKCNEKITQLDITKKIRAVVRQAHRSADDELFLKQHQPLVDLVKTRRSSYNKQKERVKEIEDEEHILDVKSKQLADILRESKHTTVYTGAGISTSANIPDYRGVEGVWTQLNAGHVVKINQNLASAVPTYTHMAIKSLFVTGLIKHVVSQNCDGLHVRSGIPPENLSEIHGNMFAEICCGCKKNYYRVFDVTEKTGFRRHVTKRSCDSCKERLKDTIVHFGELSDPSWPHNWGEAEENAEKSDVILCLGSSLKVLRSYKKLWLTDRRKCLRPTLCIVNMQWTPKDSQARLKINGRTDEIMRRVMKHLNVQVPSSYFRETDPIFQLATPTLVFGSSRSQCIPIPEVYQEKFPEPAQPPNYDYNNSGMAAHTNFVKIENNPDSSKNFNLDVTRSISTSGFDNDSELTGCDEAVTTNRITPQDSTVEIIQMPAWFGKGCRKRAKFKRGRGKRRKKDF